LEPVVWEAPLLGFFELRGDVFDAKVVGVSASRKASRRCGVFGREPLAQLRLFGRRHAAVEDHPPGKSDRSLGIDIMAVDGIAVGEASPRRVLDAPCPPGGRPLDLRPGLAFKT
jgi:hypothetical protein